MRPVFDVRNLILAVSLLSYSVCVTSYVMSGGPWITLFMIAVIPGVFLLTFHDEDKLKKLQKKREEEDEKEWQEYCRANSYTVTIYLGIDGDESEERYEVVPKRPPTGQENR